MQNDARALSISGQTSLDTSPIARQIVPYLDTFQNRLRSPRSWRVYQQDLKHFCAWLDSQGIDDLAAIDMDTLYAYHAHLRSYTYGPDARGYSHPTINRMFTVARRLIAILVEKQALASDPCAKLDIDTMPVDDETTHVALSDDQARRIMQLIDTSTSKGKRDYAIVSLLMRTGLRRNECVMLTIGDLSVERGHTIATIHYAKGGKPGRVKIPPDVYRYIEEYMQSVQRQYTGLDAPLFVSYRRGDRPSIDKATGRELRIDVKSIETTVKQLGRAIGIPDTAPLTPHGLRATFITLALENGATLEQTQYAARHRDPRMTERYRLRKFNLDNNAVDKLSFLAREEE
jgi:integrase/recombinase XerD